MRDFSIYNNSLLSPVIPMLSATSRLTPGCHGGRLSLFDTYFQMLYLVKRFILDSLNICLKLRNGRDIFYCVALSCFLWFFALKKICILSWVSRDSYDLLPFFLDLLRYKHTIFVYLLLVIHVRGLMETCRQNIILTTRGFRHRRGKWAMYKKLIW